MFAQIIAIVIFLGIRISTALSILIVHGFHNVCKPLHFCKKSPTREAE